MSLGFGTLFRYIVPQSLPYGLVGLGRLVRAVSARAGATKDTPMARRLRERDNRQMAEPVVHLPSGRHLAIDEQGVGLRATWRLDRGFLNLSLWRDDRCVETFHLTPTAAADLIGFLARGLAMASEVAAAATVRPLPQRKARPLVQALGASRATVRAARRRVAGTMAAIAERVAP